MRRPLRAADFVSGNHRASRFKVSKRKLDFSERLCRVRYRYALRQILDSACFAVGDLQRGAFGIRDFDDAGGIHAGEMRWDQAKTDGCSIPPTAKSRPASAKAAASVAPDVKTTSAGSESVAAATCILARSTMARAARPSACTGRRVAENIYCRDHRPGAPRDEAAPWRSNRDRFGPSQVVDDRQQVWDCRTGSQPVLD